MLALTSRVIFAAMLGLAVPPTAAAQELPPQYGASCIGERINDPAGYNLMVKVTPFPVQAGVSTHLNVAVAHDTPPSRVDVGLRGQDILVGYYVDEFSDYAPEVTECTQVPLPRLMPGTYTVNLFFFSEYLPEGGPIGTIEVAAPSPIPAASEWVLMSLMSALGLLGARRIYRLTSWR